MVQRGALPAGIDFDPAVQGRELQPLGSQEVTAPQVVEKRTEENGARTAQAVKRLTVVIPAFNEEAAIQQTVAELRKAFESAKIDEFDIVVVDDGSQDATQSLADGSGDRVVRHPHNVGYGRSLKD